MRSKEEHQPLPLGVRVRALPASRALSLVTQSRALASRTLSLREPPPIPAPLAARSRRAARAEAALQPDMPGALDSAWCIEAGRLDRWQPRSGYLGVSGWLGQSSVRCLQKWGVKKQRTFKFTQI